MASHEVLCNLENSDVQLTIPGHQEVRNRKPPYSRQCNPKGLGSKLPGMTVSLPARRQSTLGLPALPPTAAVPELPQLLGRLLTLGGFSPWVSVQPSGPRGRETLAVQQQQTESDRISETVDLGCTVSRVCAHTRPSTLRMPIRGERCWPHSTALPDCQQCSHFLKNCEQLLHLRS